MERRTFLIAGAVLAAGCSTDSPSADSSSAAASPTSASDRVVLGPTSDVPVAGGKVYSAEGVVVTQPVPGTFRAFDAKCTHQGCLVNEVTAEGIVCPCHNSVFRVTDGEPLFGPAPSALPPVIVRVDGDNLILG